MRHILALASFSVIPDVSVLLQDLLSPPSTPLASTTPALIAYHLSTIALTTPTLLSTLLRYLSVSPSLWRGQASLTHAGDWAALNWPRAQEVYEAVRNGVLYRAGEITKELGTGWRARRRYAAFVHAYFEGVNAEEECHPTIRLLLANAALAGLQIIKARKDKLYVGGSGLMGRAEKEVLHTWGGYFAGTTESRVGEWTGSGRGEFELVVHRAFGCSRGCRTKC